MNNKTHILLKDWEDWHINKENIFQNIIQVQCNLYQDIYYAFREIEKTLLKLIYKQ